PTGSSLIDQRKGLSLRLALRLRRLDAALQTLRFARELRVRRAEEVGVDAAVMFDGADRIRRKTQLDRMTERIAQHRAALQVRQEPAPGLVVGMADVIARLNTFARDNASPRHINDLVGEGAVLGERAPPVKPDKPRYSATATGWGASGG